MTTIVHFLQTWPHQCCRADWTTLLLNCYFISSLSNKSSSSKCSIYIVWTPPSSFIWQIPVWPCAPWHWLLGILPLLFHALLNMPFCVILVGWSRLYMSLGPPTACCSTMHLADQYGDRVFLERLLVEMCGGYPHPHGEMHLGTPKVVWGSCFLEGSSSAEAPVFPPS